MEEANVTFDDIDAIAVTYGPGLVGALLVGVSTAKALAFAPVSYTHLKNKSGVNTEVTYMKNEMNLTMLTDFYEFTMMNGFFAEGYKDKIAYFDMFFRRVPEDGGFAIMAGVEQIKMCIRDRYRHCRKCRALFRLTVFCTCNERRKGDICNTNDCTVNIFRCTRYGI